MKLILTSNGYKESPGIGVRLLEFLNKDPSHIKVFLVTIGGAPHFVEEEISQLEDLEIKRENVFVFEMNEEAWNLQDFDLVYVCGGNTFEYLYKMDETGLREKIIDFLKKGGVYFGVSAGSILACPYICTATWNNGDENDVGVEHMNGLDVFPLLLTVHFKEEDLKTTESLAEDCDYPVVALTDKQAVTMSNDDIKIIGEGKKFVFNKLGSYK